MLHTKSQGNLPSGSGEEDLKGFFLPYMSEAAILLIGPEPFERSFLCPKESQYAI